MLTDSPVVSVTEDSDGVRITTESGSWTAERAIVTGGAWGANLLPAAVRPYVWPTRILLTWFEARDPSAFRPEVFPIFIRISRGTSLYGAPSLDGATVKASLDGRAARTDDPATMLRVSTEAEMTEVRGTIASYLPGLIPYTVRADCHRLRSHRGVVGAEPRHGCRALVHRPGAVHRALTHHGAAHPVSRPVVAHDVSRPSNRSGRRSRSPQRPW
ncbi:N-methyl-L-tryptophan oxidase family protein [Calidifontibacter terrae]